METGTVKWFNDRKGYGFITRGDGKTDCFVHHSDIEMDGYKTLQEGQKVRYLLKEGDKGAQATKVVIAEE